MKQTGPPLHALDQNNHCIKLSEFIPDIKKKKRKKENITHGGKVVHFSFTGKLMSHFY